MYKWKVYKFTEIKQIDEIFAGDIHTFLNHVFSIENYTLPFSRRLIENVQLDGVMLHAYIRCPRLIKESLH